MTDPGTFALFIAPAIGFLACLGLFLATGIADRRALRRADEIEREAAQG
jgi:hypothetical protein